MNKKIVGISVVLLVLFAVGTMSVFAEDTAQEWTVTFSYYEKKYDFTTGLYVKGKLQTTTETFWASSAESAVEMAIRYCTEKYGEVASCSQARATGRSRPAN